MINYLQDGEVLTVTPPVAVASGDVLVVGGLVGVALSTATTSEAVSISTEGVYNLTKLSTAVFAAGDRVYWDTSNKRCDTAGSGKTLCGIATQAAGNGPVKVPVLVNGLWNATAT